MHLRQTARDSLPQVMRIALHPCIIGRPYRRRALRRALARIAGCRGRIRITTAGALRGHVAALPPGTVPGG